MTDEPGGPLGGMHISDHSGPPGAVAVFAEHQPVAAGQRRDTCGNVRLAAAGPRVAGIRSGRGSRVGTGPGCAVRLAAQPWPEPALVCGQPSSPHDHKARL